MTDASKPTTHDRPLTHIVALSGGKDSTALVLRLREIKPDTNFTYLGRLGRTRACCWWAPAWTWTCWWRG